MTTRCNVYLSFLYENHPQEPKVCAGSRNILVVHKVNNLIPVKMGIVVCFLHLQAPYSVNLIH